jgi:predicted DCC family thiol-disulfide oxidoreductase YuxK
MKDTAIIFFDGVCHLCNGFVDFALQNEKTPGKLIFAPLQGSTAQDYLSQKDRSELSSILLWEEGQIYRESEAVLRIAVQLKAPWNWLAKIARWIPRLIRDSLYHFVARNRYAWFGQSPTCRIPLPEERKQLWP